MWDLDKTKHLFIESLLYVSMAGSDTFVMQRNRALQIGQVLVFWNENILGVSESFNNLFSLIHKSNKSDIQWYYKVKN